MLGGMFFQSIYAQYTQNGKTAVSVSLYKNLNALDMTWVGSLNYTEGESPFVNPVAKL